MPGVAARLIRREGMPPEHQELPARPDARAIGLRGDRRLRQQLPGPGQRRRLRGEALVGASPDRAIVHGGAVDGEANRRDRRELGQRVDDLAEAQLQRVRARAGLVHRGEVDGRDTAFDRDTQHACSDRDCSLQPRCALGAGRAGEQGVERRSRDASRGRVRPQLGDQPVERHALAAGDVVDVARRARSVDRQQVGLDHVRHIAEVT